MVDAVTTSAAAGRITGGTKALASNFETFLTLLTTQMKNQDPTDPMDASEQISQLATFSQVEQSIQTVGKCRWITFGKSQGHGEPHEH